MEAGKGGKGRAAPFGGEESVGGQHQGNMVMPAEPVTSFELVEAEPGVQPVDVSADLREGGIGEEVRGSVGGWRVVGEEELLEVSAG